MYGAEALGFRAIYWLQYDLDGFSPCYSVLLPQQIPRSISKYIWPSSQRIIYENDETLVKYNLLICLSLRLSIFSVLNWLNELSHRSPQNVGSRKRNIFTNILRVEPNENGSILFYYARSKMDRNEKVTSSLSREWSWPCVYRKNTSGHVFICRWNLKTLLR